jgi:hypothetical protein
MRIEGYPPIMPAAQPRGGKAVQAAASTPAEETLSPQQKLAKLLDEKRWLADSAFGGDPDGELGKHIDLRV